jgi:hypothetical protein
MPIAAGKGQPTGAVISAVTVSGAAAVTGGPPPGGAN